MGLRDQLLAREKRPETFRGQAVFICEFGALDRVEYFEYARNLRDAGESSQKMGTKMAAFVLVRSLEDEGGRIFNDEDADSLARAISFDDLNRLFSVCAELNDLLPTQREEKEGN